MTSNEKRTGCHAENTSDDESRFTRISANRKAHVFTTVGLSRLIRI
jgi:hypothetical protein